MLLLNTLFAPLAVGGAERSVLELAVQLVGSGVEVTVATQVGPESDLPETEDVHGVTVARWRTTDRWPYGEDWTKTTPRARLAWHSRESMRPDAHEFIRGVLRATTPDIVNTHNVAGFGRLIWNQFREQPLVHTIRDYYLLCTRTTLYRSDHRCETRCLDCKVLTLPSQIPQRRPDLFVGISNHVLQKHAQYGVLRPSDGREVIPNRPSLKRTELQEPRDRPSANALGFLGRLEPAKGLPVILEAMQLLDESVSLAIGGTGSPDQRDLVVQRAQVDPRIKYRGYVDAASFLGEIGILLIPTQWDEPFGRVAWEARSRGVPIVASAVGGLPETLQGYERAHLVNDFESPLAWASSIAKAVEDADHGANTEAPADPFEPSDDVGSLYLRAYERVLGGSES